MITNEEECDEFIEELIRNWDDEDWEPGAADE